MEEQSAPPTLLEKFDALHKQMVDEGVYPSIQTTRAALAAAKTAFAEIIPEDINHDEVAAIRAVIVAGDLIADLTLPLRPETPEAINALKSIVDCLFYLLFDV